MCTNVVLPALISTVEGLAGGAIQNYKWNDADERALCNDDIISENFSLLPCAEEVKFDYYDTVYEEFSAEDYEDYGYGVDGVNLDDVEGINYIRYDFKWQDYRPSPTKCIQDCMRTSLYLTLVSSLIGGIGCLVIFIDINTGNLCHWLPLSQIPKHVQLIKIVAQAIEGWTLQFFHLTTLVLAFGLSFIHKQRLIYINLCAAYTDSTYRLLLYLFGAEDVTWRSYPLNAIFLFMVIFNSYVLAQTFSDEKWLKIKLVFQISVQLFAGAILMYLTFYILTPWYSKLTKREQIIIASTSPIFGSIVKLISRLSVQTMIKVIHPGNMYILSLGPFMASSIVYRTFQAHIDEDLYFALVCIFHGVVGFLERLSVLLRDHFYIWFYKKILKKEAFESHIGRFKRPQTQRYMSDMTICHVIHENIALLTCNALFRLYGLQYGTETGMSFVRRCGIALLSEYVFNTMSVFMLTWGLNIPILKLWRRKWKTYTLVNIVFCIFLVFYTTEYLLLAVDSKYKVSGEIDVSNRTCNASEYIFYTRII